MFPLAHYKTVVNIRRFCLFVCLSLCFCFTKSGEYSKVLANPLQESDEYSKVFSSLFQKSNEYSKVFASPLPNSDEYSKVFALLIKSGEYSKMLSLSSGLLRPFGLHQARARGSSCGLLRLSGLAQASWTPMRMLAGARTALQTKRASRSQLSQVPKPPLSFERHVVF